MLQSWRWYGPEDPVPLEHVRQAGATDIVTALHDMYDGRIWPVEAIRARRELIEAAGLRWTVVESIPVSNLIERDGAAARQEIENFKQTMRNLAEEGLEIICYNFMPIVDWTRTDLRYPAPYGGLALRFDPLDFAGYDLFVLERDGAAEDYDAATIEAARARFDGWDEETINTLEFNIISGLPGAESHYNRQSIADLIATFADVDEDRLRANLIAFHDEIIPLAESLGLRMCLHPDDPPIPLFGLPRVLSTQAQYRAIFEAHPSLANGITFCTGSLGARADNDLAAMVREFAPRIHFAHLRNVKREEDGSFFEADHLEGSTDMVEIVDLMLREERRRRAEGRKDAEFPMRPDHGHLLLDDIHKTTYPGYSAIGRLKGLAELRGVMAALDRAAGQEAGA
ncbi:mannonate dehydratase [Oceanomicrobium pacificus]|uniref:Mannonate dehydratase n=1 Tax=Oceanomicrobium pacificus TaxID=2692916 RepID=A0A6B0TWT3_9RHOB|nr:mannonate dehydratase [Oceanomicrobium pacificus]MXU65732.1 mannonate dehydratase [Oceanomicrobium pacificus]